MATEFNWDVTNEIVEGIAAVMLAPVVIPTAVVVSNPVAQAAIKQGITLAERVKEAAARTEEVFADLVAEVKDELANQHLESNSVVTDDTITGAHGSEYIIKLTSDLNEQVKHATNGVADLRLILPLGLSAIALRQLLIKGPQLDTIPWYVLAWYAFENFTKLNNLESSPPE